MNPLSKDKVEGMFLGIAIGDALGMPVETFSRQKIKETYGRVTEYLNPKGHKWFDGELPGTYTDDTQLTLAVARSLMADGFNCDSVAAHHVEAYKQTTKGWGHSTRDSVRNIVNGSHWSKSAVGEGTGNGIPMKIAPVAIWDVLQALNKGANKWFFTDQGFEYLGNLSAMTHRSGIACASGFVHAVAVKYAFASDSNNFNYQQFLEYCVDVAELQNATHSPSGMPFTQSKDNLAESLSKLNPVLTDEKIDELFGCGSCYCFHSIPFTYAYFLRNPNSIESLFDCVSAGGDTDSNASMLGGLLGALNGRQIFPQYLIDGLAAKDEILDVANRFCADFYDKNNVVVTNGAIYVEPNG